MRSFSISLVFWIVGATLAAIPMFIEVSGQESFLATLGSGSSYGQLRCNSFAVYAVVLCGVALSDIFEASRINKDTEGLLSFFTTIVFAMLLVVFLCLASELRVLGGEDLATTNWLTVTLLVGSVFLSFVAKIFSELQKALCFEVLAKEKAENLFKSRMGSLELSDAAE